MWRSEAIAPKLAGMMYALTVLFGLVVLAGTAAMAINAIVSRTETARTNGVHDL